MGFIQANGAAITPPQLNPTCSFAAPVTKGNLLFAATDCTFAYAGNIPTLTDSLGNVWVQIFTHVAGAASSGSNEDLTLFTTISQATGPCTVTATFPNLTGAGAGTSRDLIVIAEYSNYGPLDVPATGGLGSSGSGSADFTLAITNPKELVIAVASTFFGEGTPVLTPAPPWTTRGVYALPGGGWNTGTIALFDQVNPLTGAFELSSTLPGGTGVLLMAAFGAVVAPARSTSAAGMFLTSFNTFFALPETGQLVAQDFQTGTFEYDTYQ